MLGANNYKNTSFYHENARPVKNGASKINAKGAYFFTYFRRRKLILISPAFATISGRNKALASVRKHMTLDRRFRFHSTDGQFFYFTLQDTRGNEIARSINYRSHDDAEIAAAWLHGRPPRHLRNIDDYKDIEFYKKHSAKESDGFESFAVEGAYYFIYRRTGKIRLVSESYTSKAGRDNGIRSVRANMKRPLAYERRKLSNGKYGFLIRATNNQEVARSVWYDTREESDEEEDEIKEEPQDDLPPSDEPEPLPGPDTPPKDPDIPTPSEPIQPPPVLPPVITPPVIVPPMGGFWGWITGAVSTISVTTVLPWLVCLLPVAIATVLWFDRSDTVYQCYGGTVVSEKSECPAIVTTCWDDTVVTSAQACPPKIVKVEERTIVRQCFDGSMAAEGSKCPLVMTTCWNGDQVEAGDDCPMPISCKDGRLVKTAALCNIPPDPAICPSAPPDNPQPVNCPIDPRFVCSNGDVVSNKAECLPIDIPPLDDVKCWDGSFAKRDSDCPALPEPGTCNCVTSEAPIFTIRQKMVPLNLTRLELKSESCDSSGFTADQFFNLLRWRYASSRQEAQYLDNLFRSMGFETGFSGVTVNDFSDKPLQNGVRAVLGFGSKYHYAYSELNMTNPRDLQSFRVRSKNGCDINFMKTCGYHMYVCPK